MSDPATTSGRAETGGYPTMLLCSACVIVGIIIGAAAGVAVYRAGSLHELARYSCQGVVHGE